MGLTVINGKDSTIECPVCGASESLPIPMEVGLFTDWVKKFEKKHLASCSNKNSEFIEHENVEMFKESCE